MDFVVAEHVAYLAVGVGLTIWVARALARHGRVFLVDAFGGNAELAEAVNRLLVVGFYLLNVGFVALALKYGDRPTDVADAIESLSTKEGLVLVVLGGMHFVNLYIFARVRRRGLLKHQKPPVAPEAFVDPRVGFSH